MKFLKLFLAIASLSFLGFATRSLADATVPIEKALAQIQGKTQVPILIPSVVPNMDEMYVIGEATSNGYSLNFSFTPRCGGTACNYAWMDVQRGGALFDAAHMNPRDTLEKVELANGIHGQFANTCGSYCLATVQWQSQGVTYNATVKNGKKETAIALANSAIQGGVRKTAATPRRSATEPIYVGKASTGEAVYYQGARFQCGDLPRTDECWWRSPVIVYKIGNDGVTAIGDCKEQVFKSVMVGDKVVAQNMRPQSDALRQVLDRSCHPQKYRRPAN